MRTWKLLSLALVLGLVLAACGAPTDPGATPGPDTGETPDPGAPANGDGQQGGTLVFAGSRVAASLDPALTSDGESFRILRQIYEPLVHLEAGSVSEITGVLAESWEGEPEDTEYVFNLRQNVEFHDGTPFNADAVVTNFERWDTFPEEMQGNAYYIGAVFGGFGEDSIIENVEATDEFTVTVTLREPKADFIHGIALTPFSMISPAVLEEMQAADPAEGTFGTDPSQGGTGPYRWDSYTPGESGVAELVRNENYWGDPADGPFLDRLVIQAIANPSARLQALQAGGVMGIDLVAPTEYEIVEDDENLVLLERFAYNTLYVAVNPTATEDGPLADLNVRQAVAHAIDKEALIDPFYGGRGSAADIFVPPTSETWHDVLRQDVPVYEYDPDRARELLEEAGYGPDNPATVEFWYPTEVTRPYMPDPAGLAEAVITMLEEVGFQVEPNSSIWGTEYIPAATAGEYDLHFLGWTGDYDDPWNWYGYHFDLRGGEPNPQFNCDPPGLREAFEEANASFDQESRGQAFNEVVRLVHEDVCFVTIVHGDTALAFQPEVQGYVAAPTGSESFKSVWIQQEQ